MPKITETIIETCTLDAGALKELIVDHILSTNPEVEEGRSIFLEPHCTVKERSNLTAGAIDATYRLNSSDVSETFDSEAIEKIFKKVNNLESGILSTNCNSYYSGSGEDRDPTKLVEVKATFERKLKRVDDRTRKAGFSLAREFGIKYNEDYIRAAIVLAFIEGLNQHRTRDINAEDVDIKCKVSDDTFTAHLRVEFENKTITQSFYFKDIVEILKADSKIPELNDPKIAVDVFDVKIPSRSNVDGLKLTLRAPVQS